jgi:protein tyrosine phosphatase
LPYDDNVVRLQTPIDNVSYINASFLTNIEGGQAIEIACQGPLTNTIVHFCQMLVEQNVKVIVMLTKCYELNKEGTI